MLLGLANVGPFHHVVLSLSGPEEPGELLIHGGGMNALGKEVESHSEHGETGQAGVDEDRAASFG